MNHEKAIKRLEEAVEDFDENSGYEAGWRDAIEELEENPTNAFLHLCTERDHRTGNGNCKKHYLGLLSMHDNYFAD